MTSKLLPPLLVALLLVFLQARSGIDSYVVVVPAMAFFAYVVAASGRLLLAAAGARDADPPAAWTLGLLATCLSVYALAVTLPLTAGGAFGIVAATVIGLELGLARRLGAPRPDWRAMTGFALCVAFTAAWCVGPAGAYETLRAQGVLPVWSDYFFHGGLISQFGDARALGRGSIYLADYPSSFYHFASYGAAAALAGILDQPGLPLAVATWLPLGFLAMLAGAYALGARLGGGAAGGIAALAAVAMLPDASNYGLRNGWFSFHWTLIAHAGASYALGAAFLSLALLDRWSSERARPLLVASALLTVSTILFRAHVFVLFLPAWIATAALCSARENGRRRLLAWLMIGGLAASAVAANLVLAYLAATGAGFWRFGGPALAEFLTYVHTGHEPTAYTDVYANLVKRDAPVAFTLAAGIVLAVLAALGAFVVLLPAAARLARGAGVLRPIDAASGYLVFCWLLLMLFAPVPWHGDPSDLIHRPFVLVYAACAIWTLCLLLRILAARAAPARRLWPAILASAIIALPAVMAGAQSMARPKFRWGAQDDAARVAPGLLQAAAFLRKHAAAGDIFAAAGLTAGYATFDLPTQLCALSGMPAYLSRPYMEMIKDAPRKRIVAARLAALQEVEALADYGKAMTSLRSSNVQWYVVAADRGPRWDADRKRAAFSAGTVALYAVDGASSGRAFHDEMRVRNAHKVVPHEAAHALEFASGEPLVRIPVAHVPAAVQ